MSRKLKQLFCCIAFVFITLCLTYNTSFIANATTNETKNGLEVEVRTDKNYFNKDEEISVYVDVKNTNLTEFSHLNLESIIPEEFEIKEGKGNIQDFSVAAGETKTFSVKVLLKKGEEISTKEIQDPTTATVEKVTTNTSKETVVDDGTATTVETSKEVTTEKSTKNDSKEKTPKTGDTAKYMVYFTLMGVSVVLILVIGRSKKTGRKLLSLFLSVTLVGVLVPYKISAGESVKAEIKVDKKIEIDNQEVVFAFILSYNYDDGGLELKIDNGNQMIITEEEKIIITGSLSGKSAIQSIKAYSTNYYDENKEFLVTGVEKWSTEIDLAVGTNEIKVEATDIAGNLVSSTITVNRNNSEINYSDNVKVADEGTYQQLADGMIAHWNDDNGTPEDESDDKLIVLVKEDCLLLSQIKESKLLPGEVYIIPQNDVFLTGFSGIYNSHRAPIGNSEYTAEEYQDSEYEEIIFEYVNFSDLFDTDLSLDLSSGLDAKNPISFATTPDGTSVPVEYENKNEDIGMASFMNKTYLANQQKYSKAGWITDELKTKMLPKISVEVDAYNRVNVSMKWKDVVLYDHDGIKNDDAVDYGQVKLTGNFYIKNLRHEGGIEWHPSLNPFDLQLLPQQIKSKLTYNYGGEIQLKTNASVSTQDIVKKLNARGTSEDSYENKKKLWGLEVSGVNTFDNKVVIGVLGLNLAPTKAFASKTISGAANKSTISPSVVIFIYIDLDGNINAQGVMTAGHDVSVEKGYNIQKNGYTGSYGSQAQNRSDKHFAIGNNRALDIYDKQDGNIKFNIQGKIEAELDLGIGAGAGIFIAGICPGTVDGSIFGRTRGTVEGTVNIAPKLNVDGTASLYVGAGVKGDINIGLAAKCKNKNGGDIGNVGLNFNKHFEKMFWERTLSTDIFSGVVYQSDNDGDNSNNLIVDDATVTLKSNANGRTWTTKTVESLNQDHHYTYKFANIPEGEYTLTVEKDGYATYINKHLIISGTMDENVFIDKLAALDGICKLSGKITIADEDTDTTNNQPLADAKITLSTISGQMVASVQSVEDGTYSFDNVAPGNYVITVSKQGYLSVMEALGISDNIENFYNTMLEIISDQYQGNGNASGSVYDAINGQKVPNIKLVVRSGVGMTTGTVVKTLSTNDQGDYKISNIPAGNYTIQVVDERSLEDENQRYKNSIFNIKVLGGFSIPNQNGYITNGLKIDQLRIVLRWNERPRDLDSHLISPDGDGGYTHIYYYDRNDGVNYLDHDDTDSYGPETISLYETRPGVYTYYVHDYTNRGIDSCSELAESGAYVEVYYGDSDVALAAYYVPNEPGTLWKVFEYDSESGTITPVNTMSYCSSASNVGR